MDKNAFDPRYTTDSQTTGCQETSMNQELTEATVIQDIPHPSVEADMESYKTNEIQINTYRLYKKSGYINKNNE
jgi:hypothetical protein